MFAMRIYTFLVLTCLASVANLSAQENCSTVNECASLFALKIKNHEIYIEEFTGKNYTAKVDIQLTKNFEIKSVEIIKSTGNEAFQSHVLTVIKNVGDFKEFNGLPEKEARVFRQLQIRIYEDRKSSLPN